MAGKGSREICVRDDSVLIGTKRGGEGRGGEAVYRFSKLLP